ncbi:MAG: glycosyltransferase, partial [Prevotellaceae bacterium]|nr:glycosyltransferase [Prevotellaceae bacterium]
QVKYALKNRKNLTSEIRNMLITVLQPLLKPFAACLLKSKYRTQYDNSDTVVVLSENYIRPYLALAGAKDEKKIHAISNALTFNEFISDEEILKKQKEVLIVARLEEHTKRLSLALKIWKGIEKINTLNDWRLTIVGDGKDEGYYKHLCEKFKLERCKFEGRQNPLAYYKQASVFMMTSAAEGWPMTLMESIQMGVVPVVFDSFGSLHDIVTDGENGLIVPEKHISEYVAALSKLMSNNELRQKMAMNAVESSKRFTVENVTKQWIELFNRLLDFWTRC